MENDAIFKNITSSYKAVLTLLTAGALRGIELLGAAGVVGPVFGNRVIFI